MQPSVCFHEVVKMEIQKQTSGYAKDHTYWVFRLTFIDEFGEKYHVDVFGNKEIEVELEKERG